VLARTPLGEASAFVTLLTPELGILRARAQSVRRPGAKLAASLATLAESSVVLVRGREGWRLAGAILEENWFKKLRNAPSRRRAARIAGLLLRLVAGEENDPALFRVVRGFFQALSELDEPEQELAEVLADLRIISALGLDAGIVPGEASAYAPSLLASVAGDRMAYVRRINQGIEASGL